MRKRYKTYCTSLIFSPILYLGNRKVGRRKSTWKRKLQMNLKRRSTKLSVKPQQLLLQRKKERPWPMLYLEINGNYDDDDPLPL